MREVRAFIAAFAVLASMAAPAHAQSTEIAADAVETHEYHYQVDGHEVTTYVHLFRESPYHNPKLIEQMKRMGLDHTVFLEEETEQSRAPSTLSDYQELQDDVSAIENVPVIKVRQKKGFFKKLGQLWNVSFNRSTRKPVKADYSFGLVSSVGEAGMTLAMVFAAPGISIENGAALVVASTALAYVNNVWNGGINYFLSGGKKALESGAKAARFWALSLTYDFVQTQFLKWVQVGSDISTWNVQSTVLMNTVVSGIGDVKLNNNIYKAFGDDPEKLARANYYINSISSVMSSIDLMQSRLLPVLTQIGAYDLRLSAPILIGYYVGANLMLTKYPAQTARVVDFIYNSMQAAKKAVGKALRSCASLFHQQHDDDSRGHDSTAASTP